MYVPRHLSTYLRSYANNEMIKVKIRRALFKVLHKMVRVLHNWMFFNLANIQDGMHVRV